MQISDKFFYYDGHPSYLYGLRFSWLDKTPDVATVSEKEYIKVRNKTQNTFHISKSDHPDPLVFDAEIISDRVLSEHEVRRVYTTFFNKNQYKKLTIPTDSGENIHLNSIITNVERIEGGVGNSFGVVGFSVTVECDAPWGWTDLIEVVYENPSPSFGKYFSIYNYSDSNDYIYPEVTLTVCKAEDCGKCSVLGSESGCIACANKRSCLSSSALAPEKALAINQTDAMYKGLCVFADDNEKTITLSPKSGVIKDSHNINNIENTNKYFIRLLPGENIFYIENIKKITFKFKEARILV